MKKLISLAIALGILIGASYADDLSIESLSIVPPGTGCKYEWQATVRNNGAAIVGIIAVQGRQGNTSNWHPATGGGIVNLGTGQEKSTTGKWFRKPGMTEFKLEIYHGGGIVTEEIMPLALEPPTDLQITSANFHDNGYNINIRNNSSHPATEVIVQATMASPQTPNTWVAIGGMTIECIASNDIGQRNAVRPPGWKDGYTRFKVILRRGGASVGERIFDYTPAPTTKKVKEEPTKPKTRQPFLRRIWPRKK